jgi:hypothetical protein
MSHSEDEQIKEIYARFGVAMYFAQVLENDLVNALVVWDFLRSHVKAATSPGERGTDGIKCHRRVTL